MKLPEFALRLVGSALALTTVSGYAQAPHLIDLGAHTGYAINNAGQVALDGGIYQNRVFTPLPPIPGYTASITVNAISANGIATGSWSDASISGVSDFTYINGTYVHIGVLTAYDHISGTGINASGLEVGVVSIEPFANGIQYFGFMPGVGTFYAFPTYQGGCQITDPRTWGAGAFGINDLGQVTGTAVAGTGPTGGLHAFIYQAGNWTDLRPGAGYAINAKGP